MESGDCLLFGSLKYTLCSHIVPLNLLFSINKKTFLCDYANFQRYFTSDFSGKDSGTVFLMIGGEGEASPEWMVAGAWIEYAKKMKAFCFQLEHRYYGKSRPTEYIFRILNIEIHKNMLTLI